MRKILLMLMLSCIFITGCSMNKQTSTNVKPIEQQTQVSKTSSDEAKINDDQNKIDNAINEIMKEIDNGNYTLNYSHQYDKYKDNKAISNLLIYATMLSRYKDYKMNGTNNVVTDDIALLDPYYTGVKSDEINQFVAKFMNRDKWIERNNMLVSIQQKQDEYNKKPSPTIGMTQQEVLNSKWGKPNSINKTTTANGINEQWVYGLTKYLYFDNGKLTGIQE